MLVVLSLLVSVTASCDANYILLMPETNDLFTQNHNLTACALKILTKYYRDSGKLTYIKLHEKNDDLLKVTHSEMKFTVTVRTFDTKIEIVNRAYIIIANDEKTFKNTEALMKDEYWNPYARFMIIIYHLHEDTVKGVFDMLLELRVNNAVVVNGTETAEVYAYNPYENYACGRYYTRIIQYGKCYSVTDNLYPLKEETGLRRCNLRVSIPHHLPPFTIDPRRSPWSSKHEGVEQKVFSLLSEIEKFNVSYTFDSDPEPFSVIDADLAAFGPLGKLQNNETDVMIGGLYLTVTRANTFTYAHGYLDYDDEINIVVKKALPVRPSLQIFCLFSLRLWMLIISIFVVYCVLMILLLRAEDRARVVLVLFDAMLCHGWRVEARPAVNALFVVWVWYAYFISNLYTTTLLSHIMKPCVEHQVQDKQDIAYYKLKPHVWNAVKRFEVSEDNITLAMHNHSHKFHYLQNTLKTISERGDFYGIIPKSAFHYYKYDYYNKYGKSPFYTFRKKYSKLIYSILLYKGFPRHQTFKISMLRIRESGLVDKFIKDIYYEKMLKFSFGKKQFGLTLAMPCPWLIYGVGITLSSITFIIEILVAIFRKNTRRILNGQ